MLLKQNRAGSQVKSKLGMANMPSGIGLAFSCKHSGLLIDVKFIYRRLKGSPKPFALVILDWNLADTSQGEDSPVQ
jgi:hypothetical protein